MKNQGKIHPLRRNDVIKILESNGFVLVASHRHSKFKKFDEQGKCIATMMVSHHSEIQKPLIKAIIKQSQKPEEEFY